MARMPKTTAAQPSSSPASAIPAIVLGHMARHQIKRTGEQGAGMALAGLLLGWAAVIFGILAIAGLAVFAATSTGRAFTAHPHPGFGPPGGP